MTQNMPQNVPPNIPPSPAPPAPPLRRPGPGRTILWTLVIFLCGAASGWGIGLLSPFRPPPPPGPGELPVDLIVRSMTDELLLSADQTHKVDQVYRQHAQALRAIRDEMAPRFIKEYDALQADLKQILTPEQFQRWKVRFDRAYKRFMPPPPRRPGPDSDQGPPDSGPPDRFPPDDHHPHGPPPGPPPDAP